MFSCPPSQLKKEEAVIIKMAKVYAMAHEHDQQGEEGEYYG